MVRDERKIWKGKGSGWRGEAIRHSLSARGIKSAGRSREGLRSLLSEVVERKHAIKQLKDTNKPLLRSMDQYLQFKRTRKGLGRLYSFDDIRRIRLDVIRSGDQSSIAKADDFWKKIVAYEESGFIPIRRFTKEEKSFFRGRRKIDNSIPLSARETKSVRSFGFSVPEKLQPAKKLTKAERLKTRLLNDEEKYF